MVSSVTWWEVAGKTKKRRSAICFAPLNHYRRSVYDEPWPDKIFYCPKIHDPKAVTPAMVDFYVNFLKEMFGESSFECRMAKRKTDIKRATFKLSTTNKSYIETLVYLTAFRYLNEFPILVIKLFEKLKNSSSLSLDERFKIFQEIHIEVLKEGLYNDLWGHGLIGNTRVIPITIEKFRENLNTKKPPTVQGHFK